MTTMRLDMWADKDFDLEKVSPPVVKSLNIVTETGLLHLCGVKRRMKCDSNGGYCAFVAQVDEDRSAQDRAFQDCRHFIITIEEITEGGKS